MPIENPNPRLIDCLHCSGDNKDCCVMYNLEELPHSVALAVWNLRSAHIARLREIEHEQATEMKALLAGTGDFSEVWEGTEQKKTLFW